MMKTRSLGFIAAAALMLAGCANMPSFLSPRTNSAAAQAPAAAPASAGSNVVYYDFDDIAVPADFKLVRDHSAVYQSGSLKNGVLVFDGRVEPVSAANFMVASMAKDNWRQRCAFKYGRTLMVFEKPGRMAVVTLTENITNTRLEVWVAPLPESAPAQPTSYPLAD